MIVTLQTERVQTLADVRAVIDGNDRLDYQFTDREAAYEFIRRTLVRFDYPTLSKPDKGIIGRYLAKMTGLSRAQMTRLVGQHRATGRVTDRRGGAPVRPFERRYTGADTGLDRDELDHYLTHRLRLAGCEIPLFEPPAIEALFQSARGLPRLINRIAHYALTATAVNDARTVNAGHLEHAVAELRL